MVIDREISDQIKREIAKYEQIAIISHRNPDGDSLGSALALFEYFQLIGKHAVLINSGAIGETFAFLPHIQNFTSAFDPLDYDLIIAVDCAAAKMTGFTEAFPQLFEKTQPLINIDHHHGCNDHFGTINFVVDAPSTSCILYQHFKLQQIPITREMATFLFLGLSTDTGSFMHGNTTPEAYRIASQLLMRGANFSLISREIFKKKPVNKLKLWGKVLENVHLEEDGIVFSAIQNEDFQRYQATQDDLSGVIDFINSIPEAKYSMILTEKGDKVKGSLRTQHNIDVSEIASRFGGGGHKKAAGFMVPGRLQKRTIWEIVE